MAAPPITRDDGTDQLRKEPDRTLLIEKVEKVIKALGLQKSFSTSRGRHISGDTIIHIHGLPAKAELAVGLLLRRIPDILPQSQISIVNIDDALSCAIQKECNGTTCTVIRPTNATDKLEKLINIIFDRASSSSIFIFSTPSTFIEHYESTTHCSFFTLDATSLLYPLTACVEKWLYRQYTKEQISQSHLIIEHRCPIVLFEGGLEGDKNTEAAIEAAADTLLNRLFIHSPEEIGPLIPPLDEGRWTKKLGADACPGHCILAGFAEENDAENGQTLEQLDKLARDKNSEPYVLILGRYGSVPDELKEYISFIVSLNTNPPDRK